MSNRIAFASIACASLFSVATVVSAQPATDAEPVAQSAPDTVTTVTQITTAPGQVAAAPPARQAQAYEPVPPAPKTHDWNDVSHINGIPVKVGEIADYEKLLKRRTMISSNPIGWIAGFFGVSVSHALTDNIAIRGDINYINLVENDSLKLWEFGVGAPIYLRRTYHGPFLEPGIILRANTESENIYDAQGNYLMSEAATSVTGGPQVLFGWQWLWDSGMSVALAAGAGRNIIGHVGEYESEMFANGYFRIGYAF